MSAAKILRDYLLQEAFVAREKTIRQSAEEFFRAVVNGYLTKSKWDGVYGAQSGTVSLFTEDHKPFEGLGVVSGDTIIVAPGTSDELEGKVLGLYDPTTLYIPAFGEESWASGTFDLPYTIYVQETSDVRTEGDSPFNLATDDGFALRIASSLAVREFLKGYLGRTAEAWAGGFAAAITTWLNTAVFMGVYGLAISQPTYPENSFRNALIGQLKLNLQNQLTAEEAAGKIADCCDVFLKQASAKMDLIHTVYLVPDAG